MELLTVVGFRLQMSVYQVSIDETIGKSWRHDLDELKLLKKFQG